MMCLTDLVEAVASKRDYRGYVVIANAYRLPVHTERTWNELYGSIVGLLEDVRNGLVEVKEYKGTLRLTQEELNTFVCRNKV